jgi:5-methylcytosine-specific restriction endonuclease McrA
MCCWRAVSVQMPTAFFWTIRADTRPVCPNPPPAHPACTLSSSGFETMVVMARKRRKYPALVPAAEHRRNRSYGRRWRTVRAQVLARDGHRCTIRGPGCKGVATVVDHVIPERVTGPVYDPALLRSACQSCNMWAARGKQQDRLPVSRSHAGLRFPPNVFGDGGCPHRALDGSGDWCVGSREKGHWTRWWLGSPEAPYWGPDDPRQGSGGVIA